MPTRRRKVTPIEETSENTGSEVVKQTKTKRTVKAPKTAKATKTKKNIPNTSDLEEDAIYYLSVIIIKY